MRIVGIYIIDIQNKTCQYKDALNFVNTFSRRAVKELMHEFAIHAAETLLDPERKIFEHPDWSFSCQRFND